jgi:phage terminase large subunit-like protein
VLPVRESTGKSLVRAQDRRALDLGRESLKSLLDMRERMGDYNFSSQYQQSPIPQGGNIVKFDWLRHYGQKDLPEKFDAIIQGWDTANKSSDFAKYSVCTTWGRCRGQVYLLHVYRARLDYPDLKRKVKELAHRHSARVILIEDKARIPR